MRCTLVVDGALGPPASAELAELPVTGTRLDHDGTSYLVLEVDWYGEIRGYADAAEMALVTMTEIEDSPRDLHHRQAVRRRKARFVVQALRARGML